MKMFSEGPIRAIAALVPENTPETDKMPKVMHEVHLSNGTMIHIMASDPIAAIDLVNGMLDEYARQQVDVEIALKKLGITPAHR